MSVQSPPPDQRSGMPTRPRKSPQGSGMFGRLRAKIEHGDPVSAQMVRWGLLAFAVGTTIAAVIMLVTGGFDTGKVTAHNPGSPQPTGAVAGEAFGTAKAGDCLNWTQTSALDLSKVDCSSKHLFEVTATIDLAKYPGREFSTGSKYPDSLRFTELRDEHCVSATQAYLGGRFDPRGKYEVGLMWPGKDGWKAGERTIRCGLQVDTTTGEATIPSAGRVSDVSQSKVFDVGTCIGISRNLPTDPIDCGQQHAYEIVSTIDLGTHFTGGPPSKDEQDKWMEEQCAQTSTDYLGSGDALRNKTLTLFWDYIDTRSWLAGSRSLNCFIGKGAQEGFAPITGSARGDILIDGQAPVPPPNNGRSTPQPLPGAAPPVIPTPR